MYQAVKDTEGPSAQVTKGQKRVRTGHRARASAHTAIDPRLQSGQEEGRTAEARGVFGAVTLLCVTP